jgi:LPXTG-motif cell wall-anchored protein
LNIAIVYGIIERAHEAYIALCEYYYNSNEEQKRKILMRSSLKLSSAATALLVGMLLVNPTVAFADEAMPVSEVSLESSSLNETFAADEGAEPEMDSPAVEVADPAAVEIETLAAASEPAPTEEASAVTLEPEPTTTEQVQEQTPAIQPTVASVTQQAQVGTPEKKTPQAKQKKPGTYQPVWCHLTGNSWKAQLGAKPSGGRHEAFPLIMTDAIRALGLDNIDGDVSNGSQVMAHNRSNKLDAECGNQAPPEIINNASWSIQTTPATCDVDGSASATGQYVVLPTLDQTPGTHSATASPVEGHGWASGEEATLSYTIEPKLGYQSTNPNGSCYEPPVKPETPDPKVTYTDWMDEAWTCDDEYVTQTRVKTTIPQKVVMEDGVWVIVDDVENTSTETLTQTRAFTDEEKEQCEVTPPTKPEPLTGIDVRSNPECLADGGGTVTTTSRSWNQDWVLNEDGSDYILGERVYGDPVVETRDATEEECPSVVTPPEKPESIHGDDIRSTTECLADGGGTVTTTMVEWDQEWVLNEDGTAYSLGKRVYGEPVVTKRDATKEECPATVTPPKTEPKDPDTVTPDPVDPKTQTVPETLAVTGGGSNAVLPIAGFVLLLAGLCLSWRKRRTA